MRVVHIKMKAGKTFCGRAWSAFRKGRPGQFIDELPTTKYEHATCKSCKESIQALAKHFVEYGHQDTFTKLMQGVTIEHQPIQTALPLGGVNEN